MLSSFCRNLNKVSIFWGMMTFSPFFLAPLVHADIAQYVEDCNGCHGADGISKASDVPTIAGMSSFVLEEYMFAYVENARPCRESKYRYGDTSRDAKSMCTIASALGEDEIKAISEYYAGKEFVPADQEFDAVLAAKGAKIHRRDCEICHTDGGSYQDDDAGRLAGRWIPYLEESFADYSSGARPVLDDKMKSKMDALDAESVAALIHYYASLK